MNHWNEPGDGQNPWGNRSKDPLEDLKKRLESLFGGSSDNGNGESSNSGSKLPISKILTTFLIIASTIWVVSGFYKVENAERGIVTRFGEYVGETTEGLNWHIPWPIEEVTIVNTGVVRSLEVGFRNNRGKVLSESLMLTEDENIVDVELAIQYQIANARDYLFNVANAENTLRQTVESVLREVVGQNQMDFLITEGRAEIADRIELVSQEALDQLVVGLVITNINMQNAQAPEQVRAAFEDVVKSREDRERFINEARAYSNQIIPRARGEAARVIEEANAYKQQVIALAEGQTDRFDALYKEYIKAPELNRERLYIDAIENVLNNSNKILIDVEGGNNLLYLPLDRLIQQPTNRSLDSSGLDTAPSAANSSGSLGRNLQNSVDNLRNRFNNRNR